MKVIGSTTNNMVKELSLGPMALVMKVNIVRVSNMEWVS